MQRRRRALASLALAAALLATGRPYPSEAAAMSLDECLALAMEQHPALEGARASLGAQSARLDQVRAANALTASITASTSRQTGAEQGWSTAFTATKLLSDSGRNELERQNQGLAIGLAEESLRDVALSVRKGVKDAYFALLLCGLKRDQAAEAVATYEKHLDKARGFYEAGAKAKFDVTKAEVDLGNARIALVSAQAALASAQAALSNATGARLGTVEPVTGFLPPRPLPDEAVAVELAMENRPDLRSARLRAESGRLSIAIAAKGDAATMSISGSASLSGSDWPLDDSFRATLSLSAPVFDGGLTDARVAEARFVAEGAEATLRQARQTALYEVRTALLSVREAEARIPAAELLVRQAEESMVLAEGRYDTGVGNVLEVADAVLAFNAAKVGLFQARHDYSAALAALERTLGGELE